MRAFLPFLALLLATPAAAQFEYPVAPVKTSRTMREVMIDDLGDPAVQIAIGVSATQRNLQSIRMSRDSMAVAFTLLRTNLAANEANETRNFKATFSSATAGALFPFLSEAQVAKLRRRAILDLPLAALGTDEVAFALELSQAQRARIEAIRAKVARSALDPRRPSVRYLRASLASLASRLGKRTSTDDGEGMTLAKLDKVQPGIDEVFRVIETSARMAARETTPRFTDPRTILTSVQRRRLQNLSFGRAAAAPRLRLVVRGGALVSSAAAPQATVVRKATKRRSVYRRGRRRSWSRRVAFRARPVRRLPTPLPKTAPAPSRSSQRGTSKPPA